MSDAPHLILIDGSGFIFRAYPALLPMSRPDSSLVNAVFGFSSMLSRLIKDHMNPCPLFYVFVRKFYNFRIHADAPLRILS